jgi:serine/threonine-protein kinase HipA
MKRLLVRLGSQEVGLLERRGADTWQFEFLPEYLHLPERPVLGQAFEDDPSRVHRATLRLPAFFSNLLPEGPLRRLLARHAGVNEQREALLLAAIGQDLPGAVSVEAHNGRSDEGADGPPGAPSDEAPGEGQPLKFSLAGVQLKFSVIRRGRRLTLPASGQGGDWIVKLPDREYPGVPENEYSMLLWASKAGLEVPEFRLVPVAEIEGLPGELQFREPFALAVRRFDRASRGRRIHQEDFAQVLGLYPHEKYDKHNYETIARIVHAVAGDKALRALIRRLVFMVLSGNGDAHHKNWSLLYPDGRRGELAPAYDLVFTRAYLERDRLALNLGGSKEFEAVTPETFRRVAQRIPGGGESLLVHETKTATSRIREAFKEVEGEMRLPKEVGARLRRHLDSVRL